MAWQKTGTETTSTSPTTYSLSGIIPTTFVQILNHDFIDPVTVPFWQMGNDGVETGTVYATQRSYDGGLFPDQPNQTSLGLIGNSESDNIFNMAYMLNISGEEKLIMNWGVIHNNNGSGNPPHRAEHVQKIAFTSAQINEIKMINSNTDTYDDDSNCSFLGTD